VTIRRGEPWGSEVARPADLRVARSDAELAAWITIDPDGDYAVEAGDLHRTVGAPRNASAAMHRLPIDVLDVVTDRGRHVAVAHVVIRRPGWSSSSWWWPSWWRGRVVFVCNVDHVGRWNVAPRAHPNDGRFDVVDVAAGMRPRDRWEARRRLPTGTHVPHPAISVRTATEWTWCDPDGAHVWVDGVDTGPASTVTIGIRPDAAALLV
jgi:hypothetical protein